MRKMSFLNKERNKNTLDSLAKALTNRDKSSINIGTVMPQGSNQSNNGEALSGAGDLLTGGMKLFGGLKDSGLFSGNSAEVPSQYQFLSNSSFGSTPSDGTLFGGYNLGGANAGSGALQTSEMPTFNGFGGAETGTSASGGFSGAPWGMIANMGKGLYNKISGHSPEEYSDVEQSTIYPLQGAANGFSLGGPWGALGGALYGLGYSFKDDIGLKDSNFLTQMLFPIGMGDKGGLRIGGEPILDIL